MSRRCPACGTEYPDSIAFCGHDGTITIQVPGVGDAPDPRLGARYGDYVVVARVADGAMGRVYEGRHAESRQRVAIKVLHDEVAKDRVAVERFKREFETARDLASPYVVKVVDFGETSDRSYFLTMEYLEGQELGALLRGSGKVPPARALRVLCQVALGLDDAHGFGVIHRDLKPDNVFLARGEDGDDQVRILDFGSVKLQMEMGPKLTAFGTTLGSPYYMSPEQAMGKSDVDQRTDVFALAAILYESLSGKIAFEGSTVAEILMKIVNEMPVPLTTLGPLANGAPCPASLDDVVERGVAKNKNDRPAGTTDLAREALAAFGITAAPGRAGIEAFAKGSTAQLEAALTSATPPAARPFGAPAEEPVAPPVPPPPTARVVAHASGADASASGSGALMLLAFASLAGFALLAVGLGAYFFFF